MCSKHAFWDIPRLAGKVKTYLQFQSIHANSKNYDKDKIISS